jgi:hypothetical protein
VGLAADDGDETGSMGAMKSQGELGMIPPLSGQTGNVANDNFPVEMRLAA